MKKVLCVVCMLMVLSMGLLACNKADNAKDDTTVTVELTEVGNQPVNVVKIVKEVTGLDLKDAKALVDNAPSDILTGVSEEQANEAKAALEEKGATVTIK